MCEEPEKVQESSSQGGVCVLETLRGDDCLETVTRETPKEEPLRRK